MTEYVPTQNSIYQQHSPAMDRSLSLTDREEDCQPRLTTSTTRVASLAMERSKTVFVDIETGSLEPDAPIIEYAAVAVESGTYRELDSIDCKVQFDMADADPKALGVNKFSPDLWERWAIPEEDAAIKLALFLKRHATVTIRRDKKKPYRIAQLAAHNAEFDASRLSAWFKRLDEFFPGTRRALCTEQLAKWFIENRQELSPPCDYKLGTLACYFSLQTTPDHSALADTRTSVELARRISSLSRVSLVSAA